MEKLMEKVNLCVLHQNNLISILDEKGIILNATDKSKLLDHLYSFKPSWLTSAKVVDKFTNEKLLICDNLYTDGVYQWTQSDLYHIKNYNTPLNRDFVNGVIGIKIMSHFDQSAD